MLWTCLSCGGMQDVGQQGLPAAASPEGMFIRIPVGYLQQPLIPKDPAQGIPAHQHPPHADADAVDVSQPLVVGGGNQSVLVPRDIPRQPALAP